MKETQLQIKLPGVPKAKQGREVPPQWEWTEAAVWTERMLATLERGIKGGKWYSLYDKVWKMENLQRAVAKVAAGQRAQRKRTGADVGAMPNKAPERLPQLQQMLKEGTLPTQTRATGLDTQAGKQRNATVREYHRWKTEWWKWPCATCWNRYSSTPLPNTATDSDLDEEPRTRCGEWINCSKRDKSWVVDADLKGYFDSIPQDKLMVAVEEHVADGAVLELIQTVSQARRDGKRQRMESDRDRAPRKGQCSVRCWPTSTSTHWTI